MIDLLSGSFLGAFTLKRTLTAQNEWHQGTDTIAPALAQVALMSILFTQVSYCLKHWRWNPFPSISPKLLFVIRFFPLILGIATEFVSKEKHPKIHFIGKTLSYNIGPCIKVAFAIVTLGTIKSCPALVVSSFMGYLFASHIGDASKILYAHRQTTLKVLNILSRINLVMHSPTRFDRVIDSIILTVQLLSEFYCQLISDLCFGRYSTEVKEGSDEVSLKTIRELRTAVNPHHLKHSQFELTIDQINSDEFKKVIGYFRSELESIDFKSYEEYIKRILSEDSYFNSLQKSGKKFGCEIDFMKEGALIFFYRLEKAYASMLSYPKHPYSPSPIQSIAVRKDGINALNVDREEHLAYLLHWVQKVYQNKNTQYQTELFLINVGIHGANYCFTRLQQLPKLMEGFSRRQDPELKPALYSFLREKQNNLISNYKKCYHKITRQFIQVSSLEKIVSQLDGAETPHEFNKFLYLFGMPIGLNVDAALTDPTLDKETVTFERFVQFPLIRKFNQWFHTKHYTEKVIIKWVREAIDNHRINCNKFIDWIEVQKDYEVDLLSNTDGQICDDVIRYFLLAHGVLGIVKD